MAATPLLLDTAAKQRVPVCLLCLLCLLWQALLPLVAQATTGNLKSVSRGNGIVTSYGYDELNRLSDMVNAKGASEVSRFHYPVRADGKRTGLTERLVNADLVNNAPRVSNRSVSYDYDDAGRLTGEAGDDGLGVAYQTGYSYDKVGNRTDTLYKRATTAAPNTLSRTTTVASVFNANDWLTGQSIQTDGGAVQTQSYTYDRSGSQLTEQNGSNTPQENDWGFDGKLQGTKAQGQSTGGTTYTTDAAGNRIGVTLNTGLAQQKTTRYLVDENTSYASVVEERAPDTNDTAAQELQARYVWGNGLAPLAMWRKGSDGTVKLFFMLSDGQDSVRQLTNSSGSVTDSYFYDAWGNGLGGGSGTTVNPFRYTGQQLDPSGKYFLRARYYDPGTGRFLSHDPLMGSGVDPVTLHRYLYAGINPANYADPGGQDFSLAGLSVGMSIHNSLQGTKANVDQGVKDRVDDTLRYGAAVAGRNLLIGTALVAGFAVLPHVLDGVLEGIQNIGKRGANAQEGVEELAQVKQAWISKKGGGETRTFTRAEVEGEEQVLFGTQKGAQQPLNPRAGPSSETWEERSGLSLDGNEQTMRHGEGDVFTQMKVREVPTEGKEVTVWINKPPCNDCGIGPGQSGGLRELGRQVGAKRLTIHYQNGDDVVTEVINY